LFKGEQPGGDQTIAELYRAPGVRDDPHGNMLPDLDNDHVALDQHGHVLDPGLEITIGGMEDVVAVAHLHAPILAALEIDDLPLSDQGVFGLDGNAGGFVVVVGLPRPHLAVGIEKSHDRITALQLLEALGDPGRDQPSPRVDDLYGPVQGHQEPEIVEQEGVGILNGPPDGIHGEDVARGDDRRIIELDVDLVVGAEDDAFFGRVDDLSDLQRLLG